MQAEHLTSDHPDKKRTAAMLCGRITGGDARMWIDMAKLNSDTGEEYMISELKSLGYEGDNLERITLAWAELISFTRAEARKIRPPGHNEYDHFLKCFQTKVEHFKVASQGSAEGAVVSQFVYAIHAQHSLQLSPNQLLNLQSHYSEEVRKSPGKLTPRELQRAVRKVLVVDPRIQEAYKAKPPSNTGWSVNWV